jgi:hypothetical protein
MAQGSPAIAWLDERTCWPSLKAQPAISNPPTANGAQPLRADNQDAQAGDGHPRCPVQRYQLRGGRARADMQGKGSGHAGGHQPSQSRPEAGAGADAVEEARTPGPQHFPHQLRHLSGVARPGSEVVDRRSYVCGSAEPSRLPRSLAVAFSQMGAAKGPGSTTTTSMPQAAARDAAHRSVWSAPAWSASYQPNVGPLGSPAIGDTSTMRPSPCRRMAPPVASVGWGPGPSSRW